MIDFIFEELDGLDEGTWSGGHDHIDGIEVFLAVKASGEVGLRFDCGMEVSTQRASEPQ